MAPSEPDPVPDPERARQTTTRLLWACAVLTLLAGVFQLSGILSDADGYDGLAWVGVVVGAVCLLALIAVYSACALGRLTLRARVLQRFDLFQVTTVLLAARDRRRHPHPQHDCLGPAAPMGVGLLAAPPQRTYFKCALR